ncbi:MAG: hypothetical protein R6U98_00270 [Pirellulaceae bacterium]
MESCPTQAVLPLVGLAAEKGLRDRYKKVSLSTAPLGLDRRRRSVVIASVSPTGMGPAGKHRSGAVPLTGVWLTARLRG